MGLELQAARSEAVPPLPEIRAPRIAVVDSGLGGLTVYREVVAAVPGAEFLYLADDAGFPYGPLGEAALIARVEHVVEDLVARHAPDLVVIACNTASTLALPVLRARFPIAFVGTVPAIKPAAALSRSRMISVLATPGTVARDYTRSLVEAHAADCAVTLVGCAALAGLAEAELRGAPPPDEAILAEIAPAFVEDGGGRTDAVVMACTHYPLLLARLERLAPWPVAFIDPAPAIARRTASLLGPRSGAASTAPGRALFTSGARPSAGLERTLSQFGLMPAQACA